MQLSVDQIEAVVAFLLPVLISFMKREHFPNIYNAVIAIVIYVLAGLAAVVFSGQTFTLDNIVPAVTIFVAGGTVAYSAFWKNLEVSTP